jgi:hypothetical protein
MAGSLTASNIIFWSGILLVFILMNTPVGCLLEKSVVIVEKCSYNCAKPNGRKQFHRVLEK